ncbi:MAG: Metallophosphoesterase [Verrucomicrobiales bacterium]|nr:Metallophosphoesterase [Verrucomicrobiales bacterium]
MPIHLPAISRRKFLTRSALATAGLLVAPNLFSAPKRDENSWVLFSDIHIAANRAEVARGINMTDNFAAAVKEAIELPKRAAGVIISGDCAFNTGEITDYATLTDLLAPLRKAGLPVNVMVGNHDEREHFWGALKEAKAAKRPVKDRHATIIKTARANWFLLDSLDKTKSTPGMLGEAQCEWLKKALDANADKPAIVVGHHNLDDGSFTGFKGALLDTKALQEIIRPRKQVKVYIHGHTHRWHVHQDESGIHMINLPPTAYIFKEGDPQGWVQMNLEKEGAKLELRCLEKTHPSHGQVVDLKWRA